MTTQVEREVAEIVARTEPPPLGPAEALFVASVMLGTAMTLAYWRWLRGGWGL